MSLPEEFISYTSRLFGERRWQKYLNAFNEETPVSIRFNPFKPVSKKEDLGEAVPWCRNAFYLSERPNFTLDPLLHAGAYYVQEASSMFLDYVVREVVLKIFSKKEGVVLDLCAAPGGKSTLLRAALPDGVKLYSNEPDRKRANILMENMQKQGHPNVIVTNNLPRDYQKAGIKFDMILTDVPCSGEGMFRKDEGAIGEWSVENVLKCQALQRSIIEDIWDNLKDGGVLIYSTCTFNTRENEDNVRWILENFDAEIVPVCVKPEWNITGSLLKDFDYPVFRFIPGITKGEGLFMAVLRKNGSTKERSKSSNRLRILSDGNPQPTIKGKNIIPPHAEALLINTPPEKYPRVELSKEDALRYLHHEALVLPAETPKGFVIVTYDGLSLGFVKNIGNRANNLYPQEWRIRNL